MRTALAPLPLLLVAVATAPGCGSAQAPHTNLNAGPPARLEVEEPLLIPGEQFAWEISLRNIVGGQAALALGKPGNSQGEQVVVVKSRVESAGALKLIKEVRDDVTTWVATDSSRPVYYRANLQFGHKHTTVESHFGFGTFQIVYQRRGRAKRTRTQHLPPDETAHNAHSILGVLRAWTPAIGARSYFYAITGKRLWRSVITYRGQENIRTKLGKMAARRIDGYATRLTRSLNVDAKKRRRSFRIWISDDERRLPLKIIAATEYGEVKVELVHHNRLTL